MITSAETTIPTKTLWAGWILSVLAGLLFVASAIVKFIKPPEVLEQMKKSGMEESLLLGLGITER